MKDDQIIAIINATLIDGTGRKPIKDAMVLIKRSRIIKVCKIGEFEIPSTAKTLDVDERTIMPGIIELHGHIANPRGKPDTDLYDEPQLALLAARNLRQSLEAGITTVRDVGTGGNVDYAVKRAQSRRLFEGSRVFVSGPILCMTGGHGSSLKGMRECDGPWDCRKAVRENIKAGADFIKLSNTHRPWHGNEEFTQEELDAIVQEAHKAGKKVAGHSALMPGMVQAIRAGIDTIEHGPSEFPHEVDKETIQLMVDTKITLVPTLWTFLQKIKPDEEETEKKRIERMPSGERAYHEEWIEAIRKFAPINFKKCIDAGVKVATGTDIDAPGYDQPLAAAHEEIILMVENGLSPIEAIKAGTVNAAEALGLPELGCIAEGKIADLIVLDGNPIKNIDCLRKVLMVIQDGAIIKNLL